MKKNLIWTKILSLFVVAVSLLGILTLPVHAETITADLTYLQDRINLAVQVVYTDNGSGQVPEISFIGPDGHEYVAGVNPEEEITAQYYDNAILFLIPDARAGQWQIRYDSSFSGCLEVTCSPYTRELRIESFSIDELRGSSATVKFFVQFNRRVRYHYILNVVTMDADGNVVGRRQLGSGMEYTNQDVHKRLSLAELASYDDYRLELEVYLDEYDMEIGDTAYSESFAFTSGNEQPALEDYYVIFDRTSGIVTIDWTNAAVRQADEYIVAVFSGSDSTEPVFYDVVSWGVTVSSALVDPTAGIVTVELYWRDGTALSQCKRVSFDPMQVITEIVSDSVTGSAQAMLNYAISGEEKVRFSVQINDEENMQVLLDGTGSLGILLDEGSNHVCISHWLTDFVCIQDTAEIYSDRRPPVLSFFEDPDGVTTDIGEFLLIGKTEAGATLTVNGKQEPINADGSFSIALKGLNGGDNTFEIVVSDAMGNQIRRVVTIHRLHVQPSALSEASKWMQYMPLVVSTVLAMLLAVLALFGYRKKTEKPTVMTILKRCVIGTWSAVILSGGITLWALIRKLSASKVVNSTKFFDYVQRSVQEAYDILMDYGRYSEWLGILLWITLVLAGVALLVTIAMLLLRWFKKERPARPPKPPKAPKPISKPVAAQPERATVTASNTQPEPVVEPANISAEPVLQPEIADAPVVMPIVEPVERPVAELNPVTKPVMRFCNNCGAIRVDGAVFCIECGCRFE